MKLKMRLREEKRKNASAPAEEERCEKRRDSGDSRAKANKNILKLTYGFAALLPIT